MKKEIKLNDLKTFIDITGLDPDEKLERKQYTSDVKIEEGETKTAIFRMSCAETDMDGDIMISSGMNLQRYNKNSPVLWAHQHSALPVGLTTEIANDGNQVISKVKFADTNFANDVWSLVKMGALKCCSIGFIPLKGFIRGTKEFDQYVSEKAIKVAKNTKRIVSEWLLLENSIVNLPCNEDALALAVSTKSLNISDETIKKLGIEVKEEKKELDKIIEEDRKEELAKTEVKEEVKKEEIIPVIVVPPEEPKKEEPDFVILRYGPYVADEQDVKMAKMIKMGRII